MRLKQIKLAGFKSFVDATTVPFPAQMTAVVGPNGCGKSNIIDAVRWVLGESSAKNLRGDSMTDVIFNGATSRKPVSMASVELVFENTQGRIVGSLADRNEISVKRQVNRDSQSSYFLNGTKCRRRDITDIFLGTGLGPRSYAIIEQGMISRLIESRPHELRVFLEEAAGISKYKERRRETENRIKHTRENLDRLNDVREELSTQLEKLKRQSSAALRFKELKAKERKLKGELYAIRWFKFNEQMQQKDVEVKQQESELEAFQAQQSSGQLGIVQLKTEYDEVKANHAAVQQRYYQLGNDITRLEQVILHRKQSIQLKTEALRKLRDDHHDVRSHHELELARCEELQADLDDMLPELEIAEEQKEQIQEQQIQAEEALQQWQNQWQLHSQQTHRFEQSIQISRARIQGLENSINKSLQQTQNLQHELAELDASQDDDMLEELQETLAELDIEREELNSRKSEVTQQISDNESAIEEARKELAATQAQLSGLQGKQASLRTLINQQLASSDAAAHQRIVDELSPKGTLQECLRVDAGWEPAVHRVLHEWLDYYVLEANTDLANISEINAIFDRNEGKGKAGTLAAKVEAPEMIRMMLEQISLADSTEQALAQRHQHVQGHSIISQQGCWAADEFVSHAEHSDGVNVLLMRQQVDALDDTIEQTIADLEEQQKRVDLRSASKQEWHLKKSVVDDQMQQTQQRWQTCNNEVITLKQKQSSVVERRATMAEQISALQASVEDEQIEVAMLEEELEQAQESLAEHQIQREQDFDGKESLEAAVQQRRQQLEQVNASKHQIALQIESAKAQWQSVKDGLVRGERQLLTMQEREHGLIEELESGDEPVDEQVAELEILVETHVDVEEEQRLLADKVADIEQQVRDIEQGQQGVLQRITDMRNTMESTRLELESFRIRSNAVLEQFNELGQQLKDVLAELEADADEQTWQTQLEKTTSSISRLGAINLAAIEEYDIQAERKQYLDDQNQDLSDAMDTLEEAIRKIDRETRARFKETFEQVNTDFQNLFPKVFGGGMAYLALTGEDLLETGVTIMARPPGKKNSTIHLLSGGEKALTALSLVFAIFRLNPAPFCMLDEVDAPLDDVNVGRFCNLVKEMSSTVQFIYISHNKVAMEMASTLTGVTMQEPGVSRMVAVDVEEALSFAEAS